MKTDPTPESLKLAERIAVHFPENTWHGTLPAVARHIDAHTASLRAKLAEAEAVVAKLPKTADGVRVGMFDNLWTDTHPIEPVGVIGIREGDDGPDGELAIEVRNGIGEEWSNTASAFYSTRAAAEAAAKQEAGPRFPDLTVDVKAWMKLAAGGSSTQEADEAAALAANPEEPTINPQPGDHQ